MTPQEHIQKFLSRQMSAVYQGGACNRVELYHASADTSERLQVFMIESGETKSEDLATEIFDVANQDRISRGSSQPEKYGVLAFAIGEEGPVGQCHFAFEGIKNPSLLASFENSEPPDVKGVTGQQMRHNEALMKTTLGMVDVMSSRLVTENKMLRDRIEFLERREDEMRAAKELLLDGKAERELSSAKELMKAKRMDQIGGMVVAIAPAILSSFFGKKGATGPAGAAGDQAVKAFLSNLDQDELTGIIGSLKPHNQMTVLELYKTFQEQAKTEDVEKPYILRACGDAA